MSLPVEEMTRAIDLVSQINDRLSKIELLMLEKMGKEEELQERRGEEAEKMRSKKGRVVDERTEEIERLTLEKLRRENELQLKKDREEKQQREMEAERRRQRKEAEEAERRRLREMEAERIRVMQEKERKYAEMIQEDIRLAKIIPYAPGISTIDKYHQIFDTYGKFKLHIRKKYGGNFNILKSILLEINKAYIRQLDAIQTILDAEAAISVVRDDGEKEIRKPYLATESLAHLLDKTLAIENTMIQLRKHVDENNYPDMTTLTTELTTQIEDLIDTFGITVGASAAKEQMEKKQAAKLAEEARAKKLAELKIPFYPSRLLTDETNMDMSEFAKINAIRAVKKSIRDVKQQRIADLSSSTRGGTRKKINKRNKSHKHKE